MARSSYHNSENPWSCYNYRSLDQLASPESLVGGTASSGDIGYVDSTLSRRLRKTAAAGDVARVTELLNLGAVISHTDRGGKGALHYAAGSGEHEVVAILLRHLADPNASGKYGNTPVDDAEYWCVKVPMGDTEGRLRLKCLLTLDLLLAHGGRRTDSPRRRLALEAMAERRGVEVPWHMARFCPPAHVIMGDCAPSQTDAPLSRTLATPEDDVLEDVRTPEHLPVGWRSYVDPRSGCNYYWHMDVARPQWTRPQMDATLLPGWHRATDHVRGCDYFWQDITGVTQWECPQIHPQYTAPSLDSLVMPLQLPGTAGFIVLEV